MKSGTNMQSSPFKGDNTAVGASMGGSGGIANTKTFSSLANVP